MGKINNLDKYITGATIMEYLPELFKLISNTALLNNILLIMFVIAFIALIFKESRDTKSPIHWRDLLVDAKTNKMSLGKLGQFLGVILSNWGIIYLIQLVKTEQVAGILVWLFPLWLAFIGGTWSYGQYLKGNSNSHNRNEDQQQDSEIPNEPAIPKPILQSQPTPTKSK